MSSYAHPVILTFKADAAIPKGSVVKPGASHLHVAKSTSATAKNFGVAMSEATVAGDLIEIALPGGGGKGLAGASVLFGDLLTSDGAGALIATTSANDRVIAVAMEDASSGDLFSIHMVASNY